MPPPAPVTGVKQQDLRRQALMSTRLQPVAESGVQGGLVEGGLLATAARRSAPPDIQEQLGLQQACDMPRSGGRNITQRCWKDYWDDCQCVEVPGRCADLTRLCCPRHDCLCVMLCRMLAGGLLLQPQSCRYRRGTFNVYTAGASGAVVLCLHGAGYTGLTWSLVAAALRGRCAAAVAAAVAQWILPCRGCHSLFLTQMFLCVCVCVCLLQPDICYVLRSFLRYRVVAPDLRGHGKTSTADDADLSSEVRDLPCMNRGLHTILSACIVAGLDTGARAGSAETAKPLVPGAYAFLCADPYT